MSFAVSAFAVYIATQRTLTNLEGAFLQGFALVAGLVSSFIFGRQSATDAARDIIKPHARSAFRRLMSLYESLSRVGAEIENAKTPKGIVDSEIVLAKLEAIVIEQLATADHALEDWSDIVPEDVSELRAKLESRKQRGQRNG
ncbi:MAG: hypothetical protein DCE89_09395 [Betaproteobacteria bacterium]|jgi:hypothetical protein|nr:MAG: hypothetical protein DCE89_09395 [Betaproteobacteria bacterium]